MRDALNATGRSIFYSLCEWYNPSKSLHSSHRLCKSKLLVRFIYSLFFSFVFAGERMILPCGQKKLETVGAQLMTSMIHGQGGAFCF